MGISCPRRTAGTWKQWEGSICLSMRSAGRAIAAKFAGDLLRAGRKIYEVNCAVEEGERALCYIYDGQ